MAYTPTQWVNGQPPALNAENLNKMEAGIQNNDSEIAAAKQDLIKLDAVIYERLDKTTIGLSSGYALDSGGYVNPTLNPRCASQMYIKVNKGDSIRIANGYQYNVAYYSETRESKLIKYSTYSDVATEIDTECFIRIGVRKSDNSAITTNEAIDAININIIVGTALNELSNAISDVSTKISVVEEAIVDYLDVNRLNYVNMGLVTDGSIIEQPNPRIAETDFIHVNKGDYFSITNGFQYNLAYYTEPTLNKFRNYVSYSSDSTSFTEDVYVRFGVKKADNSNISIEDVKEAITFVSVQGSKLESISNRLDTLEKNDFKYIYCPYPQMSADGSETSDFDSDNLTADDIYDYLDSLVIKYPNMIRKEFIGNDQTNTYPINRYIICDNVNKRYKETVFIGANEHGPSSDPRECAIVVCRFIRDLVCGHSKDNKLLSIFKSNYRFVIIPVVNPWGFNRTDGNGRTNGNGVNINRNYPTVGWSKVTDSDKGSSAGSEKETQYVVQTIADYNANIALDLHCLGNTSASNDNKIHYGGIIRNQNKISNIANNMLRDYNLTCTAYSNGDYTEDSTGQAYFNQIGINGLLLEFQSRDGKTSDADTRLHTANIMEANYTFMLNILDMLISDYEGSN